jgi:hypothetical protein
MKTASLLLLLALAAPVFAAEKPRASEEETFVPREKLLSNYDLLRKKSPFEFDPPKAPQTVQIDPFEGISLAGYCGAGNQLTVYLLEGKEKKRLTVFGDGSPYKKRDESGFRVVGIHRGTSLKTTEVVLEKDGRQGTVKFDDDMFQGKAPGQVQMIKDKNGKLIPAPGKPVVPMPVNHNPVPPVAPVPNQQSSQLFIPGAANPASLQSPAPAAQPGATAAGAPARPLPDNFMNNPVVPGAAPGQAPNPVSPFQNRRKVVLPR